MPVGESHALLCDGHWALSTSLYSLKSHQKGFAEKIITKMFNAVLFIIQEIEKQLKYLFKSKKLVIYVRVCAYKNAVLDKYLSLTYIC